MASISSVVTDACKRVQNIFLKTRGMRNTYIAGRYRETHKKRIPRKNVSPAERNLQKVLGTDGQIDGWTVGVDRQADTRRRSDPYVSQVTQKYPE